jgi:hypothetical protein
MYFNASALASSRVRYVWRPVRLVFNDENNLSIAALSQTLPERLIETEDAVIDHQLLELLAGVQSGLKWSSQHPDEGGCDEDSKAAFGSVWAGAIVVARSTLRGRTR